MLTKKQRREQDALRELADILEKKSISGDDLSVLYVWFYRLRDVGDALTCARDALHDVDVPGFEALCPLTAALAGVAGKELTRVRQLQGQIMTRLAAVGGDNDA